MINNVMLTTFVIDNKNNNIICICDLSYGKDVVHLLFVFFIAFSIHPKIRKVSKYILKSVRPYPGLCTYFYLQPKLNKFETQYLLLSKLLKFPHRNRRRQKECRFRNACKQHHKKYTHTLST